LQNDLVTKTGIENNGNVSVQFNQRRGFCSPEGRFHMHETAIPRERGFKREHLDRMRRSAHELVVEMRRLDTYSKDLLEMRYGSPEVDPMIAVVAALEEALDTAFKKS
jgi:hypothetical protein